MNGNIMQENLLYLKEWFQVNPELQTDLTINGNNLICKEESQDISNFYLPEMLYNETFRNKLINGLNSYDFFHIVKVYCKTKEVIEKNNLEEESSPKIIDLIVKNENNKEFILMTTADNKKYRFDTLEPEKIINIYLEEKNKKGYVTIHELERLIKNAK